MKRLKGKIFKIYRLPKLNVYEAWNVDGDYFLARFCASKFKQITGLKIRVGRIKKVRLVETRRKSATSFRIGKRIRWDYEAGRNDSFFNKKDGFESGEGYLVTFDKKRFERVMDIKLKDGQVKMFRVVGVK